VHFLGFAMLTLLFNAIMAWAPEYFIRIHGMERGYVGIRLGLFAALFGGTGIICGGLYTDYLSRRGDLAAPMKAALLGAVILTPIAIAAPLVTDAAFSLLLFAPLLFFVSFPFGPAASALQMVSPSRFRARVSAVYLFIVNLAGIGLGGTATALVTDYVFHDGMKLHYSMSVIAAGGGMLSIFFLYFSIAPFRRLHARVLQQSAEPVAVSGQE
jgi:hypothetical protein